MTKIVGLFTTDEIVGLTDGRAAGVGDVARDGAGNEYVFAKGTGTIAQYDVVAINSVYEAAAITSALAATGAHRVGVAPVAVTSGNYAWFQTQGIATINVLSTCSASAALYTSGTAGKLDDTTTSQTKVQGVVIIANVTAAAATAAVLTNPVLAI